MSYSDKHKKSVSPVLRTTSEDRKALVNNKDNYIQYLEHQLEKATTMVHKKYEERMKQVEEQLQEQDDKFENVVKLIKLLQHFAESQEHENHNLRTHVNTSMESIYTQELSAIKKQLNDQEQQIFEISQQSNDSSLLQEIEQGVNRKIAIMMEEVRNTAMKSDLKELEQRVGKLEIPHEMPIFNSNGTLNLQVQDLKVVLDSVIQDQEYLKIQLQKMQQQQPEITKASSSTLPYEYRPAKVFRPSRGEQRDSQYSESEQPLKPMSTAQDHYKPIKEKSKSRSDSRNKRLETIKRNKQDKVKDLIKRHKMSTPHKVSANKLIR